MRRPLSDLDGQATWLSGRGVIVPLRWYVQALSLEADLSHRRHFVGKMRKSMVPQYAKHRSYEMSMSKHCSLTGVASSATCGS